MEPKRLLLQVCIFFIYLVMTLPNKLLLAGVLFLFLSCRKPESGISSDATAIIYTPINPELKTYYDFSDESYWIYTDSTGLIYDSLYIGDYKSTKDTLTIAYPFKAKNICDAVYYTLKGTKDNLFLRVRENRIEISRKYGNYFYSFSAFGSDLPACENLTVNRSACLTNQDSIVLKNHLVFKNCYSASFYFLGDIRYGTVPPASTEFAWRAGTGIIRIKSKYLPALYSELLRSHVAAR